MSIGEPTYFGARMREHPYTQLRNDPRTYVGDVKNFARIAAWKIMEECDAKEFARRLIIKQRNEQSSEPDSDSNCDEEVCEKTKVRNVSSSSSGKKNTRSDEQKQRSTVEQKLKPNHVNFKKFVKQ